MSRVENLERQVKQLDSKELAEFRNFFSGFLKTKMSGFFKTMSENYFLTIKNAWIGLFKKHTILGIMLGIILIIPLMILTPFLLIIGIFFSVLIIFDAIHFMIENLQKGAINYLNSLVQEAESGPWSAVFYPFIIIVVTVGVIVIGIINRGAPK